MNADDLRNKPATYDTVLKVSKMTHAQVTSQMFREMDLMRREMKQEADKRATAKSLNDLLMLMCELITSLAVPWFAAHWLHAPEFADYAAAIGFSGAFLATMWAWYRRY
jgi:hypothetical protein